MNVGLDLGAFFKCRNRGISNYTMYLYNHLFANDKHNTYYLLNLQGESCSEIVKDNKNVFEIDYSTKANIDLQNLNSIYNSFVLEYNIDYFYFPNALDLTMPCVLKSWFGKTKLIGTVHDIIPWILKNLYLTDKESENKYRKYCENLNQFDLLFSNSETTKNDLKKYFDINNVVNISMSAKKRDIDKNQINKVWNENPIDGKYMLYVGGVGYNKNLNRLVRSYNCYYEKVDKALPLIVVCELNDDMKRNIVFYKKKCQLGKNIIFTGTVSNERLAALYIHAEWMVFPSLYEGFGMPVLEAWNYGIPVLTSNNSSLGEITDKCAVHVNPFEIESIINGLIEIHNMKKEKRLEYIEQGKERLKQFSWEKTAQQFIDNIIHDCFGDIQNK